MDNFFKALNSYDYLDDFSLLRPFVNELIQISKMKQSTTDLNEKSRLQFEFLIRVLLDSCKQSSVKVLPPINWYYLMTCLIKSIYGNYVETELIELTIMQIDNLNSAYSLVKNYLIDTNYFLHLKVK